jgi:hypothetical protein
MRFRYVISILFILLSTIQIGISGTPGVKPKDKPDSPKKFDSNSGILAFSEIDSLEAIPINISEEEIRKSQAGESKRRPSGIGFINRLFKPPVDEKIDPKILHKIEKKKNNSYTTLAINEAENYTYAFLIIHGRITPKKIKEISDLGIELLGYHPYHAYKARIPLEKLNETLNIPYIGWVGYVNPDLKIHPNLQRKINFTSSSEEIRISINLFDNEKFSKNVGNCSPFLSFPVELALGQGKYQHQFYC